jgi:hypothetical protein
VSLLVLACSTSESGAADTGAATDRAATALPTAAHITTWDNPDAMFAAVREHLRRADSTSSTRAAPPES